MSKLLDRLTVGFRCPIDWEKMEGEGAVRFCGKCRAEVTDLRGLTAEEVEEFVQQSEGREVCVRLQRRVDGRLLTKGCPRSAGPGRAVGRAVGVAAGLALSSCASDPGCGGVMEPADGKGGMPEHGEAGPLEGEEVPILMGVMICPEGDEEL